MYRSFHTASNSLKVPEPLPSLWLSSFVLVSSALQYAPKYLKWSTTLMIPSFPSGTAGTVLLGWRQIGRISAFLKLICSPRLPAVARMASVVSAIVFSDSSNRAISSAYSRSTSSTSWYLELRRGRLSELSPCCSCPLLISWRSQWPGQTASGTRYLLASRQLWC